MKRGILIDEKQKIAFNFEGENLTAFAGDTVATALWRNGRKTLSRSFKYHRRRGILSLSGCDANTLLDIGDRPNVRADMAPLTAGMVVRARHYCGSLESDYFAALGYLSPLLPPGFYYKAFYKPRGAWKRWEPIIRRLAGLGAVNPSAAPAHCDKINLFCDTAVIGGGAAGMAAAAAAARAGKKVFLLDKNPVLGGSLNWLADDDDVRKKLLADVRRQKTVETFCRAEAVGWFADNLIAAVQGNRYLRIRANTVIAATGARDLPAVFVNNDLPGVMLTSAALRLCRLYGLQCGRRAVIAGCGESDAAAARILRRCGVDIVAVFNLNNQDREWADKLSTQGFSVYHQISGLSAAGKKQAEKITAVADGETVSFDCDAILMSGGRVPAFELPALGGAGFRYDDAKNLLRADDDSLLAGAVGGRASLHGAMEDGKAVAEGGVRPPMDAAPAPMPMFLDGEGWKFIDYEEDLQPRDLDLAIDEGFDDIQLLKRYTTAGMGPAQGKLGNLLIARHLARRLDCPQGAVGAVTQRPPAAAETLGHLAGHHFHPVKYSALHRRHRHLSAQFMVAGAWLRPLKYRGAEEESLALRNGAGIIDVSTLGKIYLIGEAAADFLEKMYIGRFCRQKVGAVRYALLLNEEGRIADDGVAVRLAKDRFLLTTTTGNADEVHRQMLLWRARWNIPVAVLNLTSAYAGINLAGPDAEGILSDLLGTRRAAELEYSRCCEVNLCGAPATLMRVGFVGEKGYEIHLPAGFARPLWDALQPHATPCGVEAQRLLRLEKGHIIVGQDTDGMTTPHEAGMGAMPGMDKDFYLGKVAAEILHRRGVTRKLVGFIADKLWKDRIDESNLILNAQGDAVGRVTSVAYSPTLQSVIGLAYAAADTAETGAEINIQLVDGALLHARTHRPPFYDPRGARQK